MIWDTLALLSGVVLLVGLMGEGYLSPQWAALLLVGLAVSRGFARALGVYWLFRLGFYGTLVAVLLWQRNFEQAVVVGLQAWLSGFEKILLKILTLMAHGDMSVVAAAGLGAGKQTCLRGLFVPGPFVQLGCDGAPLVRKLAGGGGLGWERALPVSDGGGALPTSPCCVRQ